MDRASAWEWAGDEFGDVELGDQRLHHRVRVMAARAAEHPAGRITEVFEGAAERQAAYDFLETHADAAPALLRAAQGACRARAEPYPYVLVPLDGTSLHFSDPKHQRQLGPIGTRKAKAQGLKLLDAMVLSPSGLPLGLGTLRFWAREPEPQRPPQSRPPRERESHEWVEALSDITHALGSKPLWFQVDREGDSAALLRALDESGHWFTVRSPGSRALLEPTQAPLGRWVRHQRIRGHRLLEMSATATRPARVVCLAVRFEKVRVRLRNTWTKTSRPLHLTVIHARQVRTGSSSEPLLDWLLLTNVPVLSLKHAEAVLDAYAHRWAIEELHRAGKSALCQVEDSGLRRRSSLQTWATLLFAVAARAEHLKVLARERPEAPATDALSDVEIRAIVALKRRYLKDPSVFPDRPSSLGQAVVWIAELGGYTGKSSGGPPGTITIGRGLEKVAVASEILEALDAGDLKLKKR